MINDLLEVGKTKSLGYLPIDTIVNIYGHTIEWALGYALKNGLGFLVLDSSECDIDSGAVYFYHKGMLLKLLYEYRDVLTHAGVPHDSIEEYIRYISNYIIYQALHPDAYMAIGKTFNDHRFR